MAKNSMYTVFPETGNETGSASSMFQLEEKFDRLYNWEKPKWKKKKKGKKSKRKKLGKLFDRLYRPDKKGKKKSKGKSKKRAKFDMWLRVIESSIDKFRDTALDTSSYVTKRYADHKLPVNDCTFKVK